MVVELRGLPFYALGVMNRHGFDGREDYSVLDTVLKAQGSRASPMQTWRSTGSKLGQSPDRYIVPRRLALETNPTDASRPTPIPGSNQRRPRWCHCTPRTPKENKKTRMSWPVEEKSKCVVTSSCGRRSKDPGYLIGSIPGIGNHGVRRLPSDGAQADDTDLYQAPEMTANSEAHDRVFEDSGWNDAGDDSTSMSPVLSRRGEEL